jgi:hypothetical protein
MCILSSSTVAKDLGIHDGLRLPILEDGYQIVRRQHRHLGASGDAGASDVRRDDDVLETQQRVVGLDGLCLGDVEGRSTDLTSHKSLVKRFLVHHRAARRVNQNSRLLHQVELPDRHEVIGLVV